MVDHVWPPVYVLPPDRLRYAMRIASLILLLLISPCAAAQSDADDAQTASDADLKKWVHQLGSDRFEVRESATQQLIQAGPNAIDVIASQMSGIGVEASLRGLEALRELALLDNKDAIRAEEALEELASNRATAIAHRADIVLRSLRVARTTQALKILQRLGATVSFSGVTFEEKSLGSTGVVFILLNKRWHGELDDLGFLDWLADYRGIHVTFHGSQFGDDWLRRLASTKKVISLQLNRTRMTDRGLTSISKMEGLEGVSIRYCDLSDDSLKHIEALNESIEFFSVFGSGISKPAFDKLAAKYPNWKTRYGRGGFLGIGGSAYKDNQVKGCLVSTVTPNHAANAAGIREFDIITAYNGISVTQFVPDMQFTPQEQEKPVLSLSELIGQNEPGEKVKITLLRGAGPNGRREITKEVVLGEWP